MADVTTWQRPYHDPLWLLTGVVAAAGTVFLVVAVTAVAMTEPFPAVLAVGGFAALWLTFVWRLHRAALLISPVGVRIRTLWRTRTFPWSAIARFSTRHGRLAVRLVIVLNDGTALLAPIRRGARFHVIDVNDGAARLRPERYYRLVADLNDRVLAARPATAGQE